MRMMRRAPLAKIATQRSEWIDAFFFAAIECGTIKDESRCATQLIKIRAASDA